MKNAIAKVLGLVALTSIATVRAASGFVPAGVEVRFSPNGGALDSMISQIDAAKRSVDVMSYSFSSKPLARALARAARRGVRVRVIGSVKAMSEKAKYLVPGLASYGVQTVIDRRHHDPVAERGAMHCKLIVIDSARVITGSYNFHGISETNNAENQVTVTSEAIAARYEQMINGHFAHSDPVQGLAFESPLKKDHRAGASQPAVRSRALVDARFSPKGGILEAYLEAIGSARESIDVMAYRFSDKRIAQALVDAMGRGVRVRVLADGNAATSSSLDGRKSMVWKLAQSGAGVWLDSSHHTQHSKVMVIDSGLVLTGSYNFQPAADRINVENVLMIRDAAIAEAYRKNWREHCEHAVRRSAHGR